MAEARTVLRCVWREPVLLLFLVLTQMQTGISAAVRGMAQVVRDNTDWDIYTHLTFNFITCYFQT